MYIRTKIRFSKRVLRALFVTLLSICLMIAGSSFAFADSLASLKSQYAALQQKQQQLQQQLNDLNSQVSTESAKKAKIDENISLSQQQIAILNTQISTLNTQLSEKNSDITATQQNIDTNMQEYKQQVCAMYEAGTASHVELLLSSTSVTEFLLRYDILQDISDHDNQVIDNLKSDEAQLTADKTAIQQNLTNQMSLQGSLAAKQVMLQAQLAQESAVVAQLQNNVQTTQAQSANVAQQARQTDAEINAEIAREAEVRRLQLLQQQQQASGQSGGGTVSEEYLVNYAEGFVGVPYVFGSADPRYGFDCSGFVQYVYANAAGIALTHSAAQQSEVGTPVAKQNLQPGDLVFFDTDGGGRVSHVGIYVGNDEFIEANCGENSPHEVIITGLFSSSYWSSYYLFARRIL